MAFTLLSNAMSAGAPNGGTTAGIDTTGANLIVICASGYYLASWTISDSKGNTWTALTQATNNPGGGGATIYYCSNPTVGTGHTFTTNATNTFGSVGVMAFSGAKSSSPFDQQNGAGAISGTSRQPGSVTPSEDNELLVFSLGGTGNGLSGPSVDVGSILDSDVGAAGVDYGNFTAYEIQTTATARNPSWSWSGSNESSAVIATFKAAAAGTAKLSRPANLALGAGGPFFSDPLGM